MASSAPVLDQQAAGARAAWAGLYRGAEDWHPEVKKRNITMKQLIRQERLYEVGVRRWMRSIQEWLMQVVDQIVLDPSVLTDLDWDRWPEEFLRETRPAVEKIFELGGEAAKTELVGKQEAQGTAVRQSGETVGGPSDAGDPASLNDEGKEQSPRLGTQLYSFAEPAIEVDWTIQSPQAQKWITDHGLDLSKGLSETTVKRINDTVKIGFKTGEGIPEISRRINAQFIDMSTWRARLIAQTETIRAYAQGSMQVYKEAGVKKKEWLNGQAGADGLCIGLDGEVVLMDEDFSDGSDAPPAHPGCRCAVGSVIEDFPQVMDGDQVANRLPKLDVSDDVSEMMSPYMRGAGSEGGRALKQAVRQEFGAMRTPLFADYDVPAGWQALTREMHSVTQKELGNLGVTKVKLFRGVKLRGDRTGFNLGATVNWEPLEVASWTSDRRVAELFAKGTASELGIVLEAEIPISQILSNYRLHGVGSSNIASEWWIIGDKTIHAKISSIA